MPESAEAKVSDGIRKNSSANVVKAKERGEKALVVMLLASLVRCFPMSGAIMRKTLTAFTWSSQASSALPQANLHADMLFLP